MGSCGYLQTFIQQMQHSLQQRALNSGKLCRRQKESSKYVFFFVVKTGITVVVFANLFFSLKADSVHLALEMWTCSPNKHQSLQQSAEITKMPVL